MYLYSRVAKSITMVVLFSLVAVFIGAVSPLTVRAQTPSASQPVNGVVSVKGNVTINGIDAIDGAVVFSDSRVETRDNSSATLNLPRMANVDIGCNSVVKITYGPNDIEVTVISGYARLVASKGIKGTLTWSGGKPRRTDPSMTSSSVDSGEPNVCGPIGAPPAVGGLWGLGTALLLGGGGAVIVAILVTKIGRQCDRLPSQAISNVQPCNE